MARAKAKANDLARAKRNADAASRADAQLGNDLALSEFGSELELHPDCSPSVERDDLPNASRIDVIYLDDQAPIEFPSETELGAVDALVVVAEPVTYAGAAAAGQTDLDATAGRIAPVGSVVSRTWRTPEIGRRAIHGALAVAVLGILVLYEIRTSNGVPPADGRPPASTTLQSGNVAAPDPTSSTTPGISVSTEIEDALRDSTGRPLQQPTPDRGPSVLQDPRNHVSAEVESQPPPVAPLAPVARESSPPSAELAAQITESRDAGDAAPNLARTAELPTLPATRDGEVVAASESLPTSSGSLVRDSDSELSATATRTGNDGADNFGPVPPIASPRETVLTSSDNSAPVRDLLSGYQAAYASLDAHLAKQIWPAVDERALERAFNALESQTVTFDACDLTLNDRRAVASCRGRATYVTRIGRRSSHTESRQWTFLLEKPAERWIIGAVQIR